MLETIRSKQKPVSIVILLGLVVTLMIGFGVDVRYGGDVNSAVITVDGQSVTMKQYERRYRGLENMIRAQFGDAADKMKSLFRLEQRAVDDEINDILLTRYLAAEGLGANAAMIRAHLEELPYFKKLGINEASYRQFLQSQGLTAPAFEQAVAQDIQVEQLRNTFRDLLIPSELEQRARFMADGTTVEAQYLAVKAADFEKSVNTADMDAIAKFYADHSERYRTPKKIQYTYLAIPHADYESMVEITEEDVQDAYRARQSKLFHPERFQFQQLLVKKSTDDAGALEQMFGKDGAKKEAQSKVDPNVKKKEIADQALSRIEKGEDFAAIVREMSEDTDSKEKGGDRGWVLASDLSPALRDGIASLAPGQTSKVIETTDGFYVVRLQAHEERRTKELGEVRADLEKELRVAGAPQYAAESVRQMLRQWRSGENGATLSLKDFAAKNQKKAESTNGPLAANESPADAAGLTDEILGKLGEGDKDAIGMGDTEYLVEVEKVEEPSVPPLDKVLSSVRTEYVKMRAAELAKARAEEVLNGLKSKLTSGESNVGSLLASAAQELGSLVEKAAPTSRRTPAKEGVAANPAIQRAVLSLSTSHPFADSVLPNGDTQFLILALGERKEPAPEQFAQERGKLTAELLDAVQDRMTGVFLQVLRASADIWVDPRLLERENTVG